MPTNSLKALAFDDTFLFLLCVLITSKKFDSKIINDKSWSVEF